MKNIFLKNSRTKKLKILTTPRKGAWVELTVSNMAEVQSLCEEFHLDSLIVRDVLDEDEMPRIEEDEGNVYVFARVSEELEKLRATQPMLVVVSEELVLIITNERLDIVKRVVMLPELFTTQKTRGVIYLCLEILKEYQVLINRHSKQIWQIGYDVSKIRYGQVNQFVQLEMIFNDYLLALDAMGLVVKALLSGKYLTLYETDRELVEDLFIGVTQLQDTLNARLKQMESLREAYSTMVSNRLNKTMKLLTAVTVILTLPTMVFSLFGMNVNLPLSNDPQAFVEIVLGTVLLSLILGVVFWKKDMF